MDYSNVQEKLLSLLPVWNYQIAKPFKQLLDDGVSLEMYYCIKTLEWAGGSATMSQIATWTKVPKQQMTKMVNKLVEQEFVTRYDDPNDRRIVKIQLTDRATEYISHFLEHDASCFRPLLEEMGEEDLKDFDQCLDTLIRIFGNLPSCRECEEAGKNAEFDGFEEN